LLTIQISFTFLFFSYKLLPEIPIRLGVSPVIWLLRSTHTRGPPRLY
jgi:hypothetical protein